MEINIILKILLAAMLGGIIGLERELAHKEAGLRTNILIAIGSALITVLSFKIAAMTQGADPARLTAQIVIRHRFSGRRRHHPGTLRRPWPDHGRHHLDGGRHRHRRRQRFLPAGLHGHRFGSHRADRVQAPAGHYIEKQKRNYVYLITTEEKASLLVDLRQVLTELNIHYSSARLNRRDGSYEFEIIFNTSENKNREFLDKVMLLQGVKEVLSENL